MQCIFARDGWDFQLAGRFRQERGNLRRQSRRLTTCSYTTGLMQTEILPRVVGSTRCRVGQQGAVRP
jgi:hypothetical protein